MVPDGIGMEAKLDQRVWKLRQAAIGSGRSGPIAGLSKRLARKAYRASERFFGFYIPLHTRFDGVPYFPHGVSGVHISRHSRIGKEAIILQHVTIGSNTLMDSSGLGAPTIGDRCYIGAGARIIGKLRIGDDVRVGANAVVTRDVPDGATVVGFNNVIPPRGGPRNNRYFRHTPHGWESVTGSGAMPATPEEAGILAAAFPDDD